MGGAWIFPVRRPTGVNQSIFCETPNQALGIPLIDEQLREHGMRATFFCEVFASAVHGDAQMRRVTDFLLERGHDVQLHVHPTFYHYGEYLRGSASCAAERKRKSAMPDTMAAYTELEQANLLEEACAIFERLTGRKPQAFRAGSYAANQATLRALARLKIGIDSSYNPVYPESFPGALLEANRVARLEGVWEIPITVMQTRFPDAGRLKPMEISAVSLAEMVFALEAAHQAGMRHVVLVLHSFSFVKPRDIFYSHYRINRLVVRRFRRLLEYLQRREAQFAVSTFAQLARNLSWLEEPQPALVPDLGWWRPASRKLVQAVNRIYWI